VAAGVLRAVAVAATDLYSGSGVLFVEGAADVQLWTRSHWSIERATLRIEHLMASSAIPVSCPSVEVGSRHFADGCVRNTAPLAPAIQLGADRIIAIGVRGEPMPSVDDGQRRPAPTIAQVAGVLLDAVLIDAIEADIEHSTRVNTSVLRWGGGGDVDDFREIDVLWLRPSMSIGARSQASGLTPRWAPAGESETDERSSLMRRLALRHRVRVRCDRHEGSCRRP